MRRIIVVLIMLFALIPAQTVAAEGETMQKLYIVPSDVYDPGNGIVYYGPKYFQWRFGTGYSYEGLKHYGFIGGYLVQGNLTQAQHDALILNTDVYVFPDNVDTPIPAQDPLHDFFETFNVPTDWLTPANTYREFIQQTNGIFEFSQRYQVIAGQNGAPPQTYLFNDITLDTRYNQFPASVKTYFDATLVSFGYDPALIPSNRTVRQMLKAASDEIKTPLEIGGVIY